MNEAKLMSFLNKFYEALQILEELADYAYDNYHNDDDYEEAMYLQDVYDELFEWTTKIEIHYGLLED